MRLSSFIPFALSGLALAAPTSPAEKRGVLAKRASLTDTPTTGFATQNGGTTGGRGGSTITVKNLADLKNAVKGNSPAIVIVAASFKGNKDDVRIGSNKSVIGKDRSIVLENIGLTVKNAKNVIIRNLAIKKVVGGDAVAVQLAQNVWLDHLDLSSDRNHGKDYYDGLLDLTHAADFITVSNVKLHDHYKGSLIGHSDNNAAEDRGHLRVTYANCHWVNVNSRAPSLRFGTGHVFNNFYDNVSDGINTRQKAQLLVENNVWVNPKKPLYSTDGGFAVANGNDFGGAKNTAPVGTLRSVPYRYTLISASRVKAAVVGVAGNTLSF